MIAWLGLGLGAAGIALSAGWALSVATVAAPLLVERLPVRPARRADLLVGFSALPALLVAMLAVTIVAPSVLHATGLRVDHCSVHDHHLHLCAIHHPDAPPALVAIGALLLAATIGRAAVLADAQRRASRTLGDLDALARPASLPGVRLVPGRVPVCHAVGVASPRILLARSVAARLSPVHLEAALAHERAHLERRDPLILSLLPWAQLACVPGAGRWTLSAYRRAAEQSCDAVAALAHGPVTVAAALVAMARLQIGGPASGGFAFGETDIEHRVRRLLDGHAVHAPSLTIPAGLAIGGGLLGFAFAAPESLHHAVETLLHFIG